MQRRKFQHLLLSSMVGIASLLGIYRTFLAQANDPQPPADTLPYAAYLPIIQTKHESPLPDPLLLDWDPQLTERGAVFVGAQVTAGEGYWKLVKAEWFDEQEAGGRHHILIDVLDSAGQRVVNVPITIAWADGATKVFTELKPGERYAANYAMFEVAPSYAAEPTTDAPADRVERMGLGSLERPTWKIHTSYGLVWRWAIAGHTPLTPTATLTPTTMPTMTMPLTPTPELESGVTPTPTVMAPLTPTASVTPVSTVTSTPTVTPTPTPTPSSLAEAVVVDCQPYNRGSRFEGYVYVNGQAANGYRIVFSYEADGPWATQPQVLQITVLAQPSYSYPFFV